MNDLKPLECKDINLADIVIWHSSMAGDRVASFNPGWSWQRHDTGWGEAMTASSAEVETTRSMGVGANMMSASEAPAAIRSVKNKCEKEIE